eukprot:TRINITY_DN3030_c0_g1_i2.p1 TRINITY_DN3030_c0_g1~~TRINITY_DN3030_c0_g1_i2.p1  ORF type:complete len:763 (+),score=281.47 TRINITY_DN3030_c0_g1_i2:169-2457(+)
MVRVKSKPLRSLPDIDYTLPEVAVWFFGQPATKKNKASPVIAVKLGKKVEKEKSKLKQRPETVAEVPERAAHPLAAHPDVPSLTNMQELITAAIYAGRDETGWCTFDKMYDFVSKQWRSMRRRDGSSFAADCRRAIQSGLRQTPNQLSLFRKDPNSRDRWQFIEHYEDALDVARQRQADRRARKNGRPEAESEASDAEEDGADEHADEADADAEDGAEATENGHAKADHEEEDGEAEARDHASSQEAPTDAKPEEDADKPTVEPDEASMDVDDEEAPPRDRRGRKKRSSSSRSKRSRHSSSSKAEVEREQAEDVAPTSPVLPSMPASEPAAPTTPRLGSGADYTSRLAHEITKCLLENNGSCPLDLLTHFVSHFMERVKGDPPVEQLRGNLVDVLANRTMFQRDKRKTGWYTLAEGNPYAAGHPIPPQVATPTSAKRPEPSASAPVEPSLSPPSRKRDRHRDSYHESQQRLSESSKSSSRGRGRPTKPAREDGEEDEEVEEAPAKQPKLEKSRKDQDSDEDEKPAAAEDEDESEHSDGDDDANGKADSSKGDFKEPTELMVYIIQALEGIGSSATFDQIFAQILDSKVFDKLRRRDGSKYHSERERRNIIMSRLTSGSQASKPYIKRETNKKGVTIYRLTNQSLEYLKAQQAEESPAHSDEDEGSAEAEPDDDDAKPSEEREEEIDDEDSEDEDKEEPEEPRGKSQPASRKRSKQEPQPRRQLRAPSAEAPVVLAPRRAAAVHANAINAAQGSINRSKTKRR